MKSYLRIAILLWTVSSVGLAEESLSPNNLNEDSIVIGTNYKSLSGYQDLNRLFFEVPIKGEFSVGVQHQKGVIKSICYVITCLAENLTYDLILVGPTMTYQKGFFPNSFLLASILTFYSAEKSFDTGMLTGDGESLDNEKTAKGYGFGWKLGYRYKFRAFEKNLFVELSLNRDFLPEEFRKPIRTLFGLDYGIVL